MPATGLSIQTSVQGSPRPIIYGKTRVAGNLIWYGDFYAVAQQSDSGSNGGKGGMFGGSSGNGGASSYVYYASVEIALGEGPIAGVSQPMWSSKAMTTLSQENIAILLGGASQSPWGYLTSKGTLTGFEFIRDLLTGQFTPIAGAHPGEDLAYRNTALAVGNLSLGASSSLPNYSFEVQGGLTAALASGDVEVTAMLADFLTNPRYGVPGWSSSLNADWSYAKGYSMATGLCVSYALSAAVSASQFMQDVLESVNIMPVWSDATLKLVPLGDATVSGNGFAYFPPTAPLYDLDDTDFLPNQSSFGSSNGDPVSVQRTAPRDQNNIVTVGYVDRASNYNPASLNAQDDGSILLYGKRASKGARDWKWFQNSATAAMAGQLALGRERLANAYSFTLRPRFILLDPGDIVTITDARLGLFRQWVRITDVKENSDRSLSVLATIYLDGTAAAPMYGQQVTTGSAPNYNVDPGAMNTPVIFEPTDQLGGGLSIYIAASGADTVNYGGCDAYISIDGASYSWIGRQHGAARMGALTLSLPGYPANPTGLSIDQLNTLKVSLAESAGQLASGSTADAVNFNTACWVGGEVVSYQTATLTGPDAYDLTYLVRGCYGTDGTITHAAGTPFVRLDNSILKIPFDKNRIGTTVQIKLVPFNVYGAGGKTLADVSAISYTITGAALASPLPAVTNARTFVVDSVVNIGFDEIEDFRNGIRYEIRVGSTPQTSVSLGTKAHPPFPTFGDGTYWIAAVCQPVADLVVYSGSWTEVTISGSVLTTNVVAEYDFQALGFPGTLSPGLTLTGAGSTLAVNASGIDGVYRPDTVYDLDIGRVAPILVKATCKGIGTPVGQDIRSVNPIQDMSDFSGIGSSQYVDAFIEVSIATSVDLDDLGDLDPRGDLDAASDWGPWQRYEPGYYNARLIRTRLVLNTIDPNTLVTGLEYSVLFDVPDRVDTYTAVTVPTGGVTINFTPAGSAVPAPFIFGPGGFGNPLHVQFTALGTSGNIVIDSLSLSAITFHFESSPGVPVACTGNLFVQGA
ncbi:phage tail protein [Bradyrhizobium sp. RT10b]|uniref:phage tail protein n=1 Tax=Bradyrhizobium sp. RT10b TaxID=3156331 RepID=UPI00339A7363